MLARYASLLSATEINSTFYRRHRESTFARWRVSVPPPFRFAVKLPRALSHDAELTAPRALLREFLDDIRPLEEKLGVVLVQLAPSHAFDRRRALRFFSTLRALHDGAVVLEPRHSTWFVSAARDLLARAGVAYVVTDPARSSVDALDRIDDDMRAPLYVRLHGAPRMYWSPYARAELDALARRIARCPSRDVWTIFDNTAAGAACADALTFRAAMASHPWRDDCKPPLG